MTGNWREPVERAFNDTVGEVEGWLSRREEDPRLFAPRRTMLRLLILRTWSMRTRMSIGAILTILVPILRRVVAKRGQKGRISRRNGSGRVGEGGLGISILTLTSKRSWELLCEELAERYPGRQEIQEWREREKERQLDLEDQEERGGPARRPHRIGLLQASSVDAYVEDYVKRVDRKRERRAREDAAKWRKRKDYRNNPWR